MHFKTLKYQPFFMNIQYDNACSIQNDLLIRHSSRVMGYNFCLLTCILKGHSWLPFLSHLMCLKHVALFSKVGG